KVRADGAGLYPATQGEQSPEGPPAQSGGIGGARRIFAVRGRLLNGIAGGNVFTGLLAAGHAEMRRRRQPIGQDGKGLAARMTDSASHPDPVVAWVVCLLAPLAMADDGLVATQRTPPREQLQRKRRRPRIGLVIGLWQCDKENHGWGEGLPLTVAAKFRSEDRPSPSRSSEEHTSELESL